MQLCHSDTAIKEGIINTPCPEHKGNLLRLSHLIGQIQDSLQLPIMINSAYRCNTLNARVGGVEGSQHCDGLAADIRCPALGSAFDLAQHIADSGLMFDQLILEFGRWVHISIPAQGQMARRQIMTIRSSQEGYIDGLLVNESHVTADRHSS